MAEGFDQDERRAVIEDLYRAFNARDIDAVLERLAPGVDWPDIVGSGRLHGRDAVRATWQKQWQEIDPKIEPMRINFSDDGTAHVLVDQLVRALDGEILQNRKVEHVFEFDDAFISRMIVIGLAEGEIDRRDDDEDGEDGGEGAGSGEAGE
jgi:limonene-1,2-epoxide hydrolase